MRIWFHGTELFSAEAILRDGFKAHTWFAKHLEDALEFGGDHVFEVALEFENEDRWQVCCSNPIPVSSIVRMTRYKSEVLADFTERRQAVLEANSHEASDAADRHG